MADASPVALGLQVSQPKLCRIVEEFQRRLLEGLEREGRMIKALPTFIHKLPTGAERGEYLVVDLGGSNLRVGCVQLLGAGKFALDRKKWPLSEEVKRGTGSGIFDFIAGSIKDYLQSCPHANLRAALDKGQRLHFGFTFSYPVKQDGLAHGILIQWNKAITCNDVIGEDVASLLNAALERAGLGNVKVAALLNDTVGTLVAHSYIDADTRIGVILGTGTNAAYLESTQCITKLGMRMEEALAGQEMVINVEWGAFGDGCPDYLPLLPIDKQVDAETVNPGKQMFEKLISGMYLGEIARLALKETFPGKPNGKAFGLDTSDLSDIEREDQNGSLQKILAERLGWTDATDDELIKAKNICQCVVVRSAHLCAAAIVALYRAMGSPQRRVVIAFDGSLFEHYPHYPKLLQDAVDSLHPNHPMELQLAKDESIVGAAAVLAALNL